MEALYFLAGIAATVLTLVALGGIDVEARWESHDKCENCGHEIKPTIKTKADRK